MALSIATNFIFFFQDIRKVCPREQSEAMRVLSGLQKFYKKFSFLTPSSSFERWDGIFFLFSSSTSSCIRQLSHFAFGSSREGGLECGVWRQLNIFKGGT